MILTFIWMYLTFNIYFNVFGYGANACTNKARAVFIGECYSHAHFETFLCEVDFSCCYWSIITEGEGLLAVITLKKD